MARAAAAALVLAAACARLPAIPTPANPAPPPHPRHRVEDAPRDLQAAIGRADAAIKALRDRLGAALAGEIAAYGPAAAVHVCQRDADVLAEAISAQTGVEVGRTGPRLRTTAAPQWAAAIVRETAARRAADVAASVVDLGDRVGLLRPISASATCLPCHGGPERIGPEVKAALDSVRAIERATGFAEGDLRGFFWAEAKK